MENEKTFTNIDAVTGYNQAAADRLAMIRDLSASARLMEDMFRHQRQMNNLYFNDQEAWANNQENIHAVRFYMGLEDGDKGPVKKKLTRDEAIKQAFKTRGKQFRRDRDQFYSNRRAWIEAHSPKVIVDPNDPDNKQTIHPEWDISDYYGAYKNIIADIQVQNLQSAITDSKDTIRLLNIYGLHGKGGNADRDANRKGMYDAKAEQNFYAHNGVRIFDDLTGVHGDNTTTLKAENANMSYQSVENVRLQQSASVILEARDQILKTGRAGTYDLETLGGQDEHGRQVLDRITEFSYQGYKRNKKGEFVKDPKAKFGSVIGITEAEYNEYMDIIDRLEKGGYEPVGRDYVIFDRLKKAGHQDTIFDKMRKDGVVEYDNFVGSESVQGDLFDMAREGAKRLYWLGKEQQKRKVVYNGVEMAGVDAEFLRWTDYVKSHPDITLISHNGTTFDDRMMSMTLAGNGNKPGEPYRPNSSLLSEGGRQYAHEHYKEGFHARYHFDTLMAELLFDPHHKLTKEEIRHGIEDGTTSKQLEFLVRMYDPDFYKKLGGKAHLATVDIDADATLALNTNRYGLQKTTKKSKYKPIIPDNAERGQVFQLHGGNTQLLYMKRSINFDNEGLFGFVKDAFTGTYRTIDKHSVGQDGITKEIFGQWPLQRGVAYTIDSVKKVNLNEIAHDDLARMSQRLNGQTLYMVGFKPHVRPDAQSYKTQSISYMLGTYEDIQHALQANTYYVAEAVKGAKGQVLWENRLSNEQLENMRIVKVDQQRPSRMNPLTNAYSSVLDESTNTIMNEAAARVRRSLSYKKDTQVLKFLKDMDSFVTSRIGKNGMQDTEENRDKLRQLFLKTVRQRSEELEQRIQQGEKFDRNSKEATYTLHKYFGYKDSEGGLRLYRETADSAMNSLNYMRQIAPIIEMARDAADERSGGDNRLRDVYYTEYMNAFIDKALQKQADAGHIGVVNAGTRAFNLKNYIVDMSGFREGKRRPLDIVAAEGLKKFDTPRMSIYLEGSGVGLANQLIRFQSDGLKDLSRVTDAQRFQVLNDFKNYLVASAGMNRLQFRNKADFKRFRDKKFTAQNSTLESASNYILERLRYSREQAHNAGLLDDTIRHDLLFFRQGNETLSEGRKRILNFGLTQDEMNETLEAASQHIPTLKILNTEAKRDPKTGELLRDKSGRLIYEDETHLNNLKQDARDIVDNIIFNGEEDSKFLKRFQQDHRYTDDEMKYFAEKRKIEKEDLQKIVLGYMQDLSGVGASLEYDKKNKLLTVIDENGRRTVIDNLVKQQYKDGIEYFQVGKQQIIDQLGMYEVGYGKYAGLSYGSRFMKAASEAGYRSYVLRTVYKNKSDIGAAVKRTIGDINKSFVAVTDAGKHDDQGVRAMGFFDNRDMFRYMRKAYQTGAYLQDIQPVYQTDILTGKQILDKEGNPVLDEQAMDTVLYKFLNNTEDDLVPEEYGKIMYYNLTAMGIRYNYIRDQMNQFIGSAHNMPTEKDPRRMAPEEILHMLHFEWTRNTKEGRAAAIQNADFGEPQTMGGRGEFEQMSHFMKFNSENFMRLAKDSDKSEYMYLKDVSVGQAIQSRGHYLSMSNRENLLHDVDTIVNAQKLNVTTDDLHTIVNNAIARGYIDKNDKLAEFLSLASTGEGSAIISIDVADQAFSRRSSEQRYTADNEMLVDPETGEFFQIDDVTKRNQADFKIEVSGGDVHFSYGTGFGVQADERIGATFGYQGAKNYPRAKENGIAAFGFYTHSGQLVDEETINQLLNETNAKMKIIHAQTEADMRQVLYDIMNKKGFSKEMHVESFMLSANDKLVEQNAEKGMHRFMGLALGEQNQKVGSVIDLLGGEENVAYNGKGLKIRDYGAIHLRHEFVRQDILESMTKDPLHLAQTKFGVMINTFRAQDKQLDNRQMLAAIKSQYQGATDEEAVQAFYRDIMAERNSLKKELNEKILAPLGLVKNGEAVSVISETIEAEAKHKNINAMAQRVVLQARRAYQDLTGAQKKAFGDIDQRIYKSLSKGIEGLTYENGRFLVDDVNGKINTGILQEKMVKLSTDLGHATYLDTKTGKSLSYREARKILSPYKAALAKYNEAGTTSVLTPEELQALQRGQEIKVSSNFGIGRKFYHDKRTEKSYTEQQYEDIRQRVAKGEKGAQKLLQNLDERYAEVAVTSLGQEENYDMARSSTDTSTIGKRVKWTQRNTEYMSTLVYDEDTLRENMENIDKLVKTGFITQQQGDMQKAMFKGIKAGQHVYEATIADANHRIFIGPTEDPIARFDAEGNEVKLTGDEAVRAKQARRDLNDIGITNQEIDAAIRTMKRDRVKAPYITAAGIKKTVTVASFGVASSFNRGHIDLENMKKSGFVVKNIDDLMNLGSGIDMRQNGRSWYDMLSDTMMGRKIVVDLDSKKLGGKKLYTTEAERYIALPFMAPVMMQDGEIMQADFQKSMAKVLNQIDDLQTNSAEYTQKERDDKIANIMQSVQEAKRQQIIMESQKKKIIGAASEMQFARGLFLTTARTQITGDELAGIFGKLEFNGMKLKDTAKAARAAGLMDLQYGITSAEKMNLLYDTSYFESLGFSGKMLTEARTKTREYLQTKGTLMMNMRDPQGYVGSTNAAALYFNESVKGDTFLASEALQEAKKNDNDSDKVSSGIIDGEADITINGQTRRRKIDYATYNVLKDMQGVQVKLMDETAARFQEAHAAILNQGLRINQRYLSDDHIATTNKYYLNNDGTINRNRVKKYTGIRGLGNGNGLMDFTIYNEKLVDAGVGFETGDYSKTYAIGSKEFTPEEAAKHGSNYDKLVADYLQNGISQIASDYGKDADQKDVQNAQNKFIEGFQKSKYSGKHEALARYLQMHGDRYSDQEKQDFDAALEYDLINSKRVERIAMDMKKNGAGIMNYDIYNYLQIATNAKAYTGEEGENFVQMTTAIYEDFLTPKNMVGAGDMTYQPRISQALHDVINSARGFDAEKIHEARKNLYDTLIDVGAHKSKWMKKMGGYPKNGTAEEQEQFIKDQIWNFTGLGERVDLSHFDDKAFRAGQSREGIEKVLSFLKNSNNSIQVLMEHVNNYQQELTGKGIYSPYEGARLRDSWLQSKKGNILGQESAAYKQALEDHGVTPAQQKHTETLTAMNAMRGLVARFDRLGGIKGAIAGMAGGILLVGYGSSPAAPASTQAAGAEEEQQDVYGNGGDQMIVNGVPELSDSNLNVMRGGPQKGYVINISAQTDRGQQRAIDAINGAVQSGTIPTSSSVNIQMNTTYADKINQLQINQMLANSIFG